ncbi:hypothetical protein CLHOM_24550 [Clostridium homopropionicum DSM 5847]|jgi:hypothetical protein|uniref:Uncharacterized protein n=1 Tax=Clostridium homopropionicum DSM 5847 TaxID=1121318 RepID=A0A0L6Z8R1_9CLOT|nr:hypothetical protein [Clostridium homopropionicum]KOA19349.1 hypothetical protein CLHOM_24550 [Clostridium homopropionicum DSM 5847]SFG22040.1 hypothetical protein SAMN04488501_106215 [Clostridium homopropionicum]
MAKHEFGIMQNEPMYEERFDEYEPKKYKCIEVDDDFIQSILVDLKNIDCYWHTLQIAGKGLAYCGITLIPPTSINMLIRILSMQDKLEYNDLISLANQAKEENKYIIHFGI